MNHIPWIVNTAQVNSGFSYNLPVTECKCSSFPVPVQGKTGQPSRHDMRLKSVENPMSWFYSCTQMLSVPIWRVFGTNAFPKSFIDLNEFLYGNWSYEKQAETIFNHPFFDNPHVGVNEIWFQVFIVNYWDWFDCLMKLGSKNTWKNLWVQGYFCGSRWSILMQFSALYSLVFFSSQVKKNSWKCGVI